jgi:ATP-dependent helicase/nuclease subunit A
LGARRTRALKVDAATERAQAEASSPAGSAWVSANAGSGKTFVLARRVVRLLLDGTDPGRILCLTFTKAAAAEMAKRVFKELADWTAMDDLELADEIAKIEGRRPDAALVAEARRLFARALETPGGLKIQTIHAFCERLLHQFPFEANVAGHFEVLDGQDAAALAVEARKRMLAKAEHEPDGPLGLALRTVLGATSDIGHEAAIAEFINRRDRLRAWIVDSDSLEQGLGELKARLGLARNDTVESKRGLVLSESVFSGDDLAGLVTALRLGGRNDCQAADRLAPAAEGKTETERVDGYLNFFMTSGRDKLRETSSLVSRAVKNRVPGLEEALEDERVRLEAVLDGIAAAECYETSAAMLRLADAAIGEYARLKNARGVLDFDDLIVKTANLLSRVDASQWIHYKLDRGLDHILVDEAQDTSPRQWQVIKALAEEFFAGEGAARVTRTLFAVGDEKQSIFSFQGAVPAWFSKVQRDLGGKARAARYAWADVKLHISFRSTPILLSAVDKVFAEAHAHRGVTADPDWPPHTAHRRNAPGRVTIWPMIKPPDRAEPEDWRTPLDHLGRNSPEVKLADRIAKTIARWRIDKEVLESTGEPIHPGGILILVRTRGALTDAINRELKRNDVPIAGADRLALTDHIAVMDLMALGRVMVLPEDDLSLAAVLKSPLIGLGEEQLYSVAYERPGSLWDRLRHTAKDDAGGVFAIALAKLEAWRSFADYLDPHGFYARVLGPDEGRKKFFRRLGVEAEDVLDEFLAQALAFERTHTPSMEAFLAWLEAAEMEIKRDAELLRDEVRVMTVHGAKGLEADVVFLVDNGTVPVHPSHDARVLSIEDDTDVTAQPPLLWMRSSKLMPQIIRNRVDALRLKAGEEYRRLLYVGMTRAKDRLIVCGTEKMRGTDPANGWHALVRTALEPESLRVQAADGTLESLEWRAEEEPRARHKAEQQAMTLVPPLPEWIDRPAPQAIATRRITPSTVLQGDAGGRAPKRRFDLGNPAALERGRLVHRLLQSLPDFPEERRRETGRRYLDAVAPKDWSAAERTALLDGVMAVLADPAFAPVFAAGSRAEIDVAGLVDLAKGPATLSGRIDRLAVTDERVLIVDYKTNRPAPEKLEDAPGEYVAQLALYRELLGRLYPNKAVAAAILWTERPALMEIPSSTLDRALATIVEA